MTNADIIKGDKLMVFVGGSAIAFATSHTLSLTGNTTDISSKDHGFWGASDVGNLTWECTTENLYTEDGFDNLFNTYLQKEPVTIVFGYAHNYDVNGLYLDGGTKPENDPRQVAWTAESGKGYSGKAVITSLSVNANTGENATFSCTFTGMGAIRNLKTGGSGSSTT